MAKLSAVTGSLADRKEGRDLRRRLTTAYYPMQHLLWNQRTIWHFQPGRL